ncbi:hypothetical protein [Nocardia australiensis]|uniref:hypothetical protein n=1 Tax=Nocardia australiensis TaxID=2887191 RepID=UPI001D1471B3|nr:hypothetical protein [Nocardia australiensis]
MIRRPEPHRESLFRNHIWRGPDHQICHGRRAEPFGPILGDDQAHRAVTVRSYAGRDDATPPVTTHFGRTVRGIIAAVITAWSPAAAAVGQSAGNRVPFESSSIGSGLFTARAEFAGSPINVA